MKYRAYIVIDMHWTDDQHRQAKDTLLLKIARNINLPLDHVRANTTIEQRESAADGLCYLATYGIDPPAVIDWPRWPYGMGRE